MQYELELNNGVWINEPVSYNIEKGCLTLVTDPRTDFWQRSFYGFKNDNAPALLFDSKINFTLTLMVEFDYKKQFDQAGVIIYLDSDNWFKASIEYENEKCARLGSVVTNLGYSDWATSDISMIDHIWYRLSRRGADFLVEASFDGENFKQMRVFHLHVVGETFEQIAKLESHVGREEEGIKFGFYACSPVHSAFTARFTNIVYKDTLWTAHPE